MTHPQFTIIIKVVGETALQSDSFKRTMVGIDFFEEATIRTGSFKGAMACTNLLEEVTVRLGTGVSRTIQRTSSTRRITELQESPTNSSRS